jgi:hypothetical protein
MHAWRLSCISAAAVVSLATAATAVAGVPDPRINEVRIDQSGDDTDEYFELVGTPGSSLAGISYIVIGDSAAGGSGVVEAWVILSPYFIKPSGFFLAVENTFSLPGTPNLYTDLVFENSDNVTHLLVMNFQGQVGDDLDFDDDGILDLMPWDGDPIDCVAVVGPGTPGVDGDHVYCATQVGPNGDFVPGQVYLCDPDLTWKIGEYEISTPPLTDTPGAINTSCAFAPPCGHPLAGSCYENNGTPNCDDLDCCNMVCAIDPTCCSDAWDQLCADLAQLECLSCGDPDAGNCFEPNGTAYCDILECCQTVCAIDPSCCELNGWDQLCADLALDNCPLTAIVQDDVAIGLSLSDPALTLDLARGDPVLNGGTPVEDSWAQPYMQSMEFDNLDGISHNPQGNLLGVNYGAAATGGEIYSLATCQAVGPGQLIGNTTGIGGAGLTLSRLGGLSVSPNNTKIAVTGYDSGHVIVFDYVAGDCLGAGAALTNGRETTVPPLYVADTQGTAWMDDNTVVAFSSDGGNIVTVDATTMVATTQVSLGLVGGDAVTDIEYNPIISPYVFAMAGVYTGVTTNTMWVLDPDNAWGIINQVDYSLSINTTREIALDSSGNLFVVQYGGNIDLILNAAGNAAGLVDNDSLDWFDPAGTNGYNGMDVAAGVTEGQPCPWDCEPEPDGEVGILDFLTMLAQWGEVGGTCDLGLGTPGVGIEEFLELLGAWGLCP